MEYALRAVVCLAQNDDKALTARHISTLTRVPAGYMSKVLQLLGKAGLARATRGRGGGYQLAASPNELSVLEVVNAVDPLKRIRACPLAIGLHGARMCPLHRSLDQVLEHAEREFGHTTIAALLVDSIPSAPLCGQRGAGKDKDH